jgi:hypothetical protein
MISTSYLVSRAHRKEIPNKRELREERKSERRTARVETQEIKREGSVCLGSDNSSGVLSCPVVPPAPYVLGNASGPEMVFLLCKILSEAQRRGICERVAIKKLIQLGEIRADEKKRKAEDNQKIRERAKRILKNETNRYVFLERISVRDFLECGLSIAQLHRYFTPSLVDLVHLGLSIADMKDFPHLLSFEMLGSLYDPTAIRSYFRISVSSIWKHNLTYDDLRGMDFQFTQAMCLFDNGSFVSSIFGLEQIGLTPYELSSLGVTLGMLRGLGLNENSTEPDIAAVGWLLRDFREAFEIFAH